MNEFHLAYAKHVGLWVLRHVDSLGVVRAHRVVLDVPARTSRGGLLCSGVLNVDQLLSLASRSAVAETVRVVRDQPIPGQINPGPMLEWCVALDESTGRWIVYRHDDQKVAVSAQEVEMDCHAITSSGVLHCRAELLVDGRTNRDRSCEAGVVRMRTLSVYDQTVLVPPIAVSGRARFQNR